MSTHAEKMSKKSSQLSETADRLWISAPAEPGCELMQAHVHLLCMSDIMAPIMMPMERKCLTDKLVSVPVVDVDVVAGGALVLPPALVSAYSCGVIAETAIVSPSCAFAWLTICSDSLVLFMDALVRVGAVTPAGNVMVYLTTTVAAKRRAMTDKRRPAAPTASEVIATIECVTLAVASAMAWAMTSLDLLFFTKSAASLSDPAVKVNPLE